MKNKFVRNIVLSMSFIILLFATVSFGDTLDMRSVYVGETLELGSYVVENGVVLDNDSIKWSSSESSVASVSADGKISAIKQGSTVVKAVSTEGTHIKEALVKINVYSMVKKVEILSGDVEIRVGEATKLNYKITPIDSKAKVLKSGASWRILDSSIATIASDGTITAKKAGNTTVYVETNDSGKIHAIKLKVNSTVDKVLFKEYKKELKVGEEYLLKPIVQPETAYLKEVTFKSDNTKVATVDKDGIVKALSDGQAIVTTTTTDGGHFTYKTIQVKSYVKDIEIDEFRVILNESKKSVLLHAVLEPKYPFSLNDVYDKTIKWVSSDSAVASIDTTGMVTAHKKGATRITATTQDGGHEDYCSIIVELPEVIKVDTKIYPQSLDIINFPTEAYVGEKIPLEFIMKPDNVTESRITYGANVGGNGQFTESAGTTYFTPKYNIDYIIDAKTSNGIKKEVKIKAKSMISAIRITPLELEKKDGDYLVYYEQRLNIYYSLVGASGVQNDEIKFKSATWQKGSKYEKHVESGAPFESQMHFEDSTRQYIEVTSDDNELKDRITFKVIPMTKDIQVDKKATIGIRNEYTPKVTFIPLDDLKYGYGEVLYKEVDTSIDKMYIWKTFVTTELEYEKKELIDIRSQMSKTDDESATKKLVDKQILHMKREAALRGFLNNADGNYCRIDNVEGLSLTDRDGGALKVAELKDDTITGYIVGKVTLLIKSRDGNKYKYTDVYIEDTVKDIVIVDKDGAVITASDRAVADEILNKKKGDAAQAEADEIAADKAQSESEKKASDELMAKAKAYFNGQATKPSDWAVVNVYNAAKIDLLTANTKLDYTKNITREEFAELLVQLYTKLAKKELKVYPTSPFVDSNNPSVILAYNLGIVNGVGNRKFAPTANITRQEMCVMIDNTLTASERVLNPTDVVTVPFVDENLIAAWAKKAISNLSKEHNLIQGVGNNTLGVLENATKEQAITIVLGVYKNLEN